MRYCIGDIHGCYITLQSLLDSILKTDQEAIFYFVGDLIDRGSDSKAVLDLIMDLSVDNKAFTIRGNHEEMLIYSYQNNLKLNESSWQYNGAKQTIISFTRDANIQLKTQELIPAKYYRFMLSLPYFIELPDYFIVHAGINFNSEKPFDDYEYMLWAREEIYNEILAQGKKIIHGHTPTSIDSIKNSIGNKNSNIINIDSGCVFSNRTNLGYLSAFNMDNNELTIAKNKELKMYKK